MNKRATRSQAGEKKIVFIVGHPRSGTTWLMWLLAQHPAVAACNHAGFFHALEPLRTWWNAEASYGKTIHVFQPASGEEDQPGYTQVRLNHLLTEQDFGALLRPAAEAVFHRITAAKPGASVAVEQTPENMLFDDMIREVLPDAYFLHILRDPRAVAASVMKAVRTWANPEDFPTHPAQIASSWVRYLERGRTLAEKHARYKSVRYEDIKEAGPATLHSIFRWLDLNSTEETCTTYLEASSIQRMRSQENLMPRGFFRRGTTRGWQQELKEQDIRVIEYLAGDPMAELGYARRYPPTERKPRGLRSYERAQKWRRFLRGGFTDLLRRLFGGNRFTRWVANRLRVLRVTLRGMER